MKNIKIAICGILILIVCCNNNISEFREGYITTEDGINLFFCLTGTGPDTVVVPAATFLAQEFKSLAQGRTLIFYDPRNRGKSATVPDSSFLGMQFELSDLESLRRHFRIKTMSLIGWSYLGAVVTLYAESHPEQVSRVVQIGSWPPRKAPYWNEFVKNYKMRKDSVGLTSLEAVKTTVEEFSSPAAYQKMYRKLLITAMMANPESYDRLKTGHQANLENERLKNMDFTLFKIRELLGEWDWRDKMSNLLMPVLTVQGEQDPLPIGSANEWVEILPNARLLKIPESGHLPFVERPDVFYPSVENFLNGHWPENSLKLSPK